MNYAVTEVSDKVRSYDTNHGPKKAYRLHLRNEAGEEHLNIELRRNADSAAPQVGQQFEGDLIDQGQYGQRLQLAYGGGGGSRPEDPQRQKRIVRQHSQSMALQAIEMAARWTLMEQPTDAAGFFALIAKTADWFDADVERAAS